MSGIYVKVSDTLTPLIMKVARETPQALSGAVNTATKAARKYAVPVIKQDANLTESITKEIGRVQLASPGNLTARVEFKPGRHSILRTGGATFSPGTSWNRGSLSASTHRLSGGGSASLSAPKSFILRGANHGKFMIAYRTGKARKAFKVIYAASAKATMHDETQKPAQIFIQTAQRELDREVSSALQTAFAGGHVSAGGHGSEGE
ncbi:phage tail protein [Methylocystis suflitae]|uniref:phage tail protein n=1 Tax=Methylocystis suflitae TaxID=2951405 RepID=UPI00210EA0E1|nr:phage tail protein [Methylocystis suflitae]MCQ4189929.1 phage tail protein [Methylocystis suflitae]